MKILVFGKNGQLGSELTRQLGEIGEVFSFDFPEIDFQKFETVELSSVGTLLVPESGKTFFLINFWFVASFFPRRSGPSPSSHFGPHRAWRR